MRTLTSTRLHFLAGAGGLLAASACSGAPGARVPLDRGPAPTGAAKQIALRITRRTGLAFPQPRPDGSMPAKRFSEYIPKAAFDAGGRHIATTSTVCPQSLSTGCNTAGSPDASVQVGSGIGYVWTSQNYSEVWDSASGTLLSQHYGAQLADGSWQVQVVAATAAVTVACPGPTSLPHEGPFEAVGSNGAAVYGSISASQGTFSLSEPDGSTTSSGTVSSSGYTLSTQRGITPPVIGHVLVRPWMQTGLGSQCFWGGMASVAMLVIAHYMAIAAIAAACDLGTVECVASSVIIASILGGEWYFYFNTVDSICGFAAG